MDTKEIIGLAAALLSIVGHLPYVLDTYRRKTKPHIFTWLIISIVVCIAFFGQLAEGAGAGAWSTGVTAVIVVVIAALAVRNNTIAISSSDKIFFGLALFALAPWLLTDNPTMSIVLVTVIDACAFIPTLRKTIKDPESETFITYVLNIVRHGLSIIAISTYSLGTVLYPAYLLVLNAVISAIIVNHRMKKV